MAGRVKVPVDTLLYIRNRISNSCLITQKIPLKYIRLEYKFNHGALALLNYLFAQAHKKSTER
jgi:hypothetical protein